MDDDLAKAARVGFGVDGGGHLDLEQNPLLSR